MNTQTETPDNRSRARWGCVLFVFLSCWALTALCSGWPYIDRTTLEEAKTQFTHETGLPWPNSAKMVSFGDDHGIAYMSSEGIFHIVFDVDHETVDKLLKSELKAPGAEWHFSEWQPGPVPDKISNPGLFSTMAIYSTHARSSITEEEADDLLNRKDIIYTASERCCESIEWHNGTLLIVDPVNNRVWLSSWDF